MKYYKILIDLKLWHLKPYRVKRTIIGSTKAEDVMIYEYGFLCFKFIITN